MLGLQVSVYHLGGAKAGTWSQELRHSPQRRAVSSLLPVAFLHCPGTRGQGWHTRSGLRSPTLTVSQESASDHMAGGASVTSYVTCELEVSTGGKISAQERESRLIAQADSDAKP